jgi:hypothetical protein
MMTTFSSPAYATMLSNGDVLLLGQKAKAFYSVLASAILSDNLFMFRLDFVTDIPCPFL